jgi:hypothetical protein
LWLTILYAINNNSLERASKVFEIKRNGKELKAHEKK